MRKQLGVVAALGALACGSTDDTAASNKGPVKDPSTGLTVAACGMPRYHLLPKSDVGKLLDQDATPKTWTNTDLDKGTAQANIKNLPPSPHGAKLYHFRYTTQDKGKVVEATGLLAFPDGGSPLPANPPTVLWLHGTTGWTDSCSPGNVPAWLGLSASVAGRGYIVVAPDFIGMNSFGAPSTEHAPWIVAEPTAIASWDALPAAAELLKTVGGGLGLSNKVVIAGGSQGGHATLFAERFGPYYAPEYEIVAQVPMVPVSSIVQAIKNGVGDSPSQNEVTVTPPLFVSYRDWYGSPKDLSGVFTDTAPHQFASTADQIVYGGDCVNKVEFLQVTSPSDVFLQSFLDAARADVTKLSPWGCYALENSIVTTSNKPKLTTTPTLFITGEKDDFAPNMEADVLNLCDMGLSVQHLSCAGAGHQQVVFWAAPDIYAWLDDRLAGKPMDPAKTCKINPPVCCSGDPTCP